MSQMCNVLVAQSGGPTTVINASIAGVIAQALKNETIDKVYGAVHGIQGVLNRNIVSLNEYFEEETLIERLKVTPSMFLGSCRYKLKDMEEDTTDYDTIFKVFEENQIRYFFYFGGYDSMDTVAKLSHYSQKLNYQVSIIGVPKTIDNDLVEIDHTPGFGSAAKYIATSIREMAHDTYIYDMQSVLIVEIMGRNAGWLTASSVLARNDYSMAPHLIYLPEKPFSTGKFIADVKKELTNRKQVIVAVSEGIRDIEGEYISKKSNQVDQFGHVMLSGTGKYLESLVQNAIGCKVRSVELNVLQRCASHISSKTDVEEAFTLGTEAVKAAVAGQARVMIALKRVSDSPYKVDYFTTDIDNVANHEKKVPDNYINEEGNDVTKEMVNYLLPLVEGQTEHYYENGLPLLLSLKQLQNQ